MAKYLIVDSGVLPDVFLKVVKAKECLRQQKAKTAADASKMAGISRSAFYKYKDSVFTFSEKNQSAIIALRAMLRDLPGVLSQVIAGLSRAGANILTINQNIPIGGMAPVSLSVSIEDMDMTMDDLLLKLSDIDGVEEIEQVLGS